MWQSSPPGSIYDYIKVASFSIGPDGLVDQWSLRAEHVFGIPAERAVGMDPIDAFVAPDLRERGQRKMAEILDGREWTGVVPFRMPDAEGGREGLAEVYVMPTTTEDGERAAVCIVVDVRTLRRIETDLAASQAIFGQSPFGFLLIDTDLRVRRANERFASIFGGTAGRPPRARRPRLPALPGGRAGRRDPAPGPGDRGLGHGHARHRLRARRPTNAASWSINLYRVHSGSGRPIGVAVARHRRHRPAAPPPARPPPPGATSPS